MVDIGVSVFSILHLLRCTEEWGYCMLGGQGSESDQLLFSLPFPSPSQNCQTVCLDALRYDKPDCCLEFVSVSTVLIPGSDNELDITARP